MSALRLGTPHSERGQEVERAYFWSDGIYYRFTYNHRTGAEAWHRADKSSADRLARTKYDAGIADRAPLVATWWSVPPDERPRLTAPGKGR